METARFGREELQALISRAKEEKNSILNPEWIMAYDQFILACSTLDAFIARSTVPSFMSEGEPLEIGTECGWAPEQSCM